MFHHPDIEIVVLSPPAPVLVGEPVHLPELLHGYCWDSAEIFWIKVNKRLGGIEIVFSLLYGSLYSNLSMLTAMCRGYRVELNIPFIIVFFMIQLINCFQIQHFEWFILMLNRFLTRAAVEVPLILRQQVDIMEHWMMMMMMIEMLINPPRQSQSENFIASAKPTLSSMARLKVNSSFWWITNILKYFPW